MNCATASLSRASSGRRRLSTNARVKPGDAGGLGDEQLGHAAFAQPIDQAVAPEHGRGPAFGATMTMVGGRDAAMAASAGPTSLRGSRGSPNFSVVSCRIGDRTAALAAVGSAAVPAAPSRRRAACRGPRPAGRRRPARPPPAIAQGSGGAPLGGAGAAPSPGGGGRRGRPQPEDQHRLAGRAARTAARPRAGTTPSPIVVCAGGDHLALAPAFTTRRRRPRRRGRRARRRRCRPRSRARAGTPRGTGATSLRCRAGRSSSRCRRARRARR